MFRIYLLVRPVLGILTLPLAEYLTLAFFVSILSSWVFPLVVLLFLTLVHVMWIQGNNTGVPSLTVFVLHN